MTVFYSNKNYAIDYDIISGSKIGILSFCGIGLALGGTQINEFSKSFEGQASLVFLKDLKRSWWNNNHFEALLEDAVMRLRSDGCRRIFAIGNSMGGSGALLASHVRTDIERVYAFVPQADPYNDKRWNQFTDKIEHIRWCNFAKLKYNSDVHIFIGGASPDANQIELFQDAGKSVHIVEGAGHNAARVLKKRKEYKAILEGFLR